MGDWDGDGDWDMALGFIQGNVKLFLNNGDMTFSEKGAFQVAGKPLTAHDGGPCLVDWDGDGKLDLLLGDGEGSVRFYKGSGDGSLDLIADENSVILASMKPQEAWKPRQPAKTSRLGFEPGRPGVRTKPYACDWNEDGKLDLLVGDFLQIQREGKPLSPAQKRELARLKKRRQETLKRLSAASQSLQSQALKASGLKTLDGADKEKLAAYSAAFGKLYSQDKSYRAISQEYSTIDAKIAKLEPRAEATGVVWVYLRK